MLDGAPIRIACPACGLSREVGRGARRLPHHCPSCGADLVADGLLEPVVDTEGAPRVALLEPPAPWEAWTLALFASLLAWSWATRGFLAAAIAGADLVFHEAGHPIFGLLGSRFLMYLGGTLGQLVFPIAAAVAFARARRAAPFALMIVWLGFNLVEVGAYAADAMDRALPLLAPDEDSHDWWNLLGMLGARERCRGIGGTIRALGWLLWVGAPAWTVWRSLRGRSPPAAA